MSQPTSPKESELDVQEGVHSDPEQSTNEDGTCEFHVSLSGPKGGFKVSH